jgi:16S rRNA (cytosine967-C5)-methyltransferase
MAYCWYRCSNTLNSDISFEAKLQVCLLLCHNGNKHVANFLPEDWVPKLDAALSDKLQWLKTTSISFDEGRLFDIDADFSEGISKQEWLYSIMHQPALFIRVRKQKAAIIHKLEDNDIPYQWHTDTCLRLPNGAAIDKLLPPDSYVVQDASSQATGSYFSAKAGQQWWDCCSGAGGKSLLLKDKQPAVKLTVTDRRDTILHNLQKRFQQYGHTLSQRMVLDVSDAKAVQHSMAGRVFDNIICDVPCTGSGTWARTPEQLYFFDAQMLQDLPKLQASIAINAAQQLKSGGMLYYITCSVFQQENEAVVTKIIAEAGLQLKQMQLLNGIAAQADCLFIAVLQKA